ncbi:hypothetical protein F5882DRAFT_387628 [Hyaloscypha sp. PMI_1271]|nr:hypothetical protein F5882DRAFT_387628 [Hyaloscypha sp. PMI_1271]
MATPQPAMEPRNPGEAKAHIARIRKDKGLSESGNTRSHNVTDLESALSLLSEKLHAKDTHFLLELIQNADDNSYGENVTPSLSITFGKDFLRLDCNEKGFLPNNVDAICRIGQSTKSGSNHTSGYIREKGIGFKSVFKVADVVLVASINTLSNSTRSSHLLSPGADNDNLAKDLRSLQPSLLIFLRRLRRIDVKIIGSSQA